MSDAERDPFMATALAEQGLRDDALQDPWEAKHEQEQSDEPKAISFLPRNARTRLSRQRVLNSYKRFKSQHDWWKQQGSGVSCGDGILHLDDIDTVSTEDQLQEHFSDFANLPPNLPQPGLDCEPHHTVCSTGQCVTNQYFCLAAKLVASMSQMLTNGAYPAVQVPNSKYHI